ncbi:PTPLA-domain-containing protein, partial [Bimuria novae-zelandiae CBS 107.79]
AKRAYLIAYNAISATLWFGVLAQVVLLAAREGVESGKVYAGLERYTRVTQSLAGLEVVHSLLGVVRAPLFTTAMQVASRLLLVWGIAYNFPQTTKYSPAYSSMLLAWSVTEVIRYSYFVFALGGSVPKLWTWLRYNTFLVLYPLGVASETWLIYRAIPPASKLDEKYGWGLWAVLATYIPGFYTLFTYMLKQRRRILR